MRLSRGFSVPELLIGLSLAGAALYVIGITYQRGAYTRKSVEEAATFDSLSMHLSELVRSSKACQKSFKALGGSALVLNPGGATAIGSIVAGASLGAGAKLVDMQSPKLTHTLTMDRLEIVQPIASGSAVYFGQDTQRYAARIHVAATQESPTTPLHMNRMLPVSLYVDPATLEIRGCGFDVEVSGGVEGVVVKKAQLWANSTGAWGKIHPPAAEHAALEVPIGRRLKFCGLTGVYMDPDVNVNSSFAAFEQYIRWDAPSETMQIGWRGNLDGTGGQLSPANDTRSEVDAICVK